MFFTSLTCRSQTETRWKCPGFLSLFLKHVSMDIINFSIFYTLFSMRGRQKQLPAPWRSLSLHKCEGQQIIKGTFKRFMLGKILIITFLYFCYCNLKSWTLSPLQLKWKVKPANVKIQQENLWTQTGNTFTSELFPHVSNWTWTQLQSHRSLYGDHARRTTPTST